MELNYDKIFKKLVIALNKYNLTAVRHISQSKKNLVHGKCAVGGRKWWRMLSGLKLVLPIFFHSP